MTAIQLSHDTRSPSTTRPSSAVNNGALETMTSVLATEVRLSEMIRRIDALV